MVLFYGSVNILQLLRKEQQGFFPTVASTSYSCYIESNKVLSYGSIQLSRLNTDTIVSSADKLEADTTVSSNTCRHNCL
ncbi:unnamed protein product, partial [Candidula unifasciata]